MRGEIKVPYLEIRVCKRKSGKPVRYWYWIPRKIDRKDHGVRIVRLASSLPPDATAAEIRHQAVVEAIELNAKLANARALKSKIQSYVPPEQRVGTLPWTFNRWKNSPKYQKLAQSTRIGTYECWMPLLEAWSKKNGHPDVRALNTPAVYNLYEEIAEPDRDTGVRALSKAKNVISTLRAALAFARLILPGVLEGVASNLNMVTPEQRDRFWTEADVNAAAKKAGELKMPSIDLGIQIAYNLGQRRADVVDLRFKNWDGEAFTLRQKKTSTLIRVPATKSLRELMHNRFDLTKHDPETHIIVNDETGAPYSGDAFYDALVKVARAANLGDLVFHDLRRTAVLRMARAGLTTPQISAVTGHSLRTAEDILKRYLPRDAEVAAGAIERLDAAIAAKSKEKSKEPRRI